MLQKDKDTFPEDIDSRLFMSDIDLEHLDIFRQYQNLIQRKMYDKASNLLKHSDSFYYGSYILNTLEDRLYRLGQYLVEKSDKEPIEYYQIENPTSMKKGIIWIS